MAVALNAVSGWFHFYAETSCPSVTPSGTTNGDHLVLLVFWPNSSLATPSGWTRELFWDLTDYDTTHSYYYIFSQTYAGAAAPSFAKIANDSCSLVTLRFTGGKFTNYNQARLDGPANPFTVTACSMAKPGIAMLWMLCQQSSVYPTTPTGWSRQTWASGGYGITLDALAVNSPPPANASGITQATVNFYGMALMFTVEQTDVPGGGLFFGNDF